MNVNHILCWYRYCTPKHTALTNTNTMQTNISLNIEILLQFVAVVCLQTHTSIYTISVCCIIFFSLSFSSVSILCIAHTLTYRLHIRGVYNSNVLCVRVCDSVLNGKMVNAHDEYNVCICASCARLVLLLPLLVVIATTITQMMN